MESTLMKSQTVRARVEESLMRVRTKDALLSTLTAAESDANARRVSKLTALDLGNIFDGFKMAVDKNKFLDLLPSDARSEFIDKYLPEAQALTDYAKECGPHTASPDLNFITDNRAQARDGAQMAGATARLIGSMNDAARRLWGRPNSSTPIAARPGADIASINRANADYWQGRNAGR
jgi:hypothetical protein